MNNYFIYWTEDRKNRKKDPSIWYCIVTSAAAPEDLELFERYNNFIYELSEGLISVGWIENKNNDNVDSFIKDQYFYNEYADENIANHFAKYEYDLVGFQHLKDEIFHLLEFKDAVPNSHYQDFINEARRILNEKYVGSGKPFMVFRDFKIFTDKLQNELSSGKKKHFI